MNRRQIGWGPFSTWCVWAHVISVLPFTSPYLKVPFNANLFHRLKAFNVPYPRALDTSVIIYLETERFSMGSKSSKQSPVVTEDALEFLKNFDTVLIVDDSRSMRGPLWKEVCAYAFPIFAAHHEVLGWTSAGGFGHRRIPVCFGRAGDPVSEFFACWKENQGWFFSVLAGQIFLLSRR